MTDLLGTDNPSPLSQSTKNTLLELFRNLRLACDQGDTHRAETLLGRVLIAFPERKGPPKAGPNPENQSNGMSRVMACLACLRKGGFITKAMARLLPSKLFGVTPSNEHMLRNLFVPTREQIRGPSDVWESDTYITKISNETVEEVLKSRDKTCGRGPSNWGYGDLQTLAKGSSSFIGDLRVIIEAILNGRIRPCSDVAAKLREGRGVALEKSNGKPRPIGIREVIMNLAYACLVREYEARIKSCLSPFDLGFRTPDGSAFPAIVAQAMWYEACALSEPRYFLFVDIENAYGTTSRSKVLQVLEKHRLYALIRPFLFTHAYESNFHFPGMGSPISMVEGLVQGDPSAPAWSQLVYADICQEVREEAPGGGLIFSYFDDIMMTCKSFDQIVDMFERLERRLNAVGLKVNLSKTVLLSNTELQQLEYAKTLSLGFDARFPSPGSSAPLGAIYLGTPIGEDDFIKTVLDRKAEEILEVVSSISDGLAITQVHKDWHDTQGVFTVVKLSVNRLARHLLRTVRPDLTMEAFEKVDLATERLMCSIFGASQGELRWTSRLRFSFPLKMSGFGITQYQAEAIPAFLGCIYKTGPLLKAVLCKESPDEVANTIVGFRPSLATISQFLADASNPPVLLPPVSEFFTELPAPGRGQPAPSRNLQPVLMKKVQEKFFLLLQDDIAPKPMTDNQTPPPNQKTRVTPLTLEQFLVSACSDSDTMRVFDLPIVVKTNRMPGAAFRMAGRVRLGLPVTEPVCHVEGCPATTIDTDGRHAGRHCARQVNDRHKLVSHGIASWAQAAKIHGNSPFAVYEEVWLEGLGLQKQSLDSASLRADIVLESDDGDKLIVDVTITHPDPNDLHDQVPGAAVNKASQSKVSKYNSEFKMKVPQVALFPFAMDTFGRLCPHATALIKTVAASIGGDDRQKVAKAARDIRNKVAASLAIGQYRLVSTYNYYNGSTHRHYAKVSAKTRASASKEGQASNRPRESPSHPDRTPPRSAQKTATPASQPLKPAARYVAKKETPADTLEEGDDQEYDTSTKRKKGRPPKADPDEVHIEAPSLKSRSHSVEHAGHARPVGEIEPVRARAGSLDTVLSEEPTPPKSRPLTRQAKVKEAFDEANRRSGKRLVDAVLGRLFDIDADESIRICRGVNGGPGLSVEELTRRVEIGPPENWTEHIGSGSKPTINLVGYPPLIGDIWNTQVSMLEEIHREADSRLKELEPTIGTRAMNQNAIVVAWELSRRLALVEKLVQDDGIIEIAKENRFGLSLVGTRKRYKDRLEEELIKWGFVPGAFPGGNGDKARSQDGVG